MAFLVLIWFAGIDLAAFAAVLSDIHQTDEKLHHSRLNKNTCSVADYLPDFLSAFSNCQINNICHVPHNQAVQIIAAGLDNQRVDDHLKAELYKLLAQYYIGVISDYEKVKSSCNTRLH